MATKTKCLRVERLDWVRRIVVQLPGGRFQAWEPLTRIEGLLPECQGQNRALAVLQVPSSLNCGLEGAMGSWYPIWFVATVATVASVRLTGPTCPSYRFEMNLGFKDNFWLSKMQVRCENTIKLPNVAAITFQGGNRSLNTTLFVVIDGSGGPWVVVRRKCVNTRDDGCRIGPHRLYHSSQLKASRP